jgi:hypothetical protein
MAVQRRIRFAGYGDRFASFPHYAVNIFRCGYRLTFPLLSALSGLGMNLRASNPATNAQAVLPELVVKPSVQTDISLGTSTYTLSRGQIETMAQGSNAPFNQIMLRVPGISQESAGQVHFRQEDPYYQYSINGVLLPRAINGFGEDIDTRFVNSVTFKVGALPAQYAWGNYGIVSIQTKSGNSLKGGEASVYGGSNDTLHSTVSFGGTSGQTDYFFTGSFLHNSRGIENPTSSARAIHDDTDQYREAPRLSTPAMRVTSSRRHWRTFRPRA